MADHKYSLSTAKLIVLALGAIALIAIANEGVIALVVRAG